MTVIGQGVDVNSSVGLVAAVKHNKATPAAVGVLIPI